jgi:D-amino-acid oxidase
VDKRVAVVGCGVAGLTSGVRLLEQGFSVTILAREIPPGTTSDVAGAFWSAGSAEPGSRVAAWCRVSLEAFRVLARDPAAGVALTPLHELKDKPFDPRSLALTGDLREAASSAFPAPWKFGFSITAPRIDVPVYMPWLLECFFNLGGRLEQRAVETFSELGHYPLVVNCAGLGAKTLAADEAVYPVRGQVVRVKMPPGLPPDIVHVDTETTVTYIVPRSRDCILGGIYQRGDSNLAADMGIASSIIERTAAFYPALSHAEVLEHRVGLRPGRREVRLELDRSKASAVIHNYGHGSIGHTLSWGCAAEVAELAEQVSG